MYIDHSNNLDRMFKYHLMFVDHSRKAHFAAIDEGIVLGADHAGVVYTAELGTETMTLLGTESGTFDQAMTTADGLEGTVATTDDGKFEAQLTGTTTGELQVEGIETEFGTNTTDETGKLTTAELGTEAMTLVGTEFGTLVHATITTDGEEAIVIT